jgi:hypothetical protein
MPLHWAMSFSVFPRRDQWSAAPRRWRERERGKEKGQKQREGESEHFPKLFVQPRSDVFPLFQRAGSTTSAKLRLNLLPTVSQCALFASCIEWHEFVRCVHSGLPIHISHQRTVAHRGYHGQIRTWRRVTPDCERWGDWGQHTESLSPCSSFVRHTRTGASGAQFGPQTVKTIKAIIHRRRALKQLRVRDVS